MAEATAFEAITSRQAWYAGETVSKYDAVMFGTDGRYKLADGTRPFAGIVQYGADAAGEMCTVVRGTFPGVASAEIAEGALLTVTAGKFVTATTGVAIGVALTAAAAAGELVAVSMLETPFTVTGA